MKRNTDLTHWPDHLHPVFAAIGAAMNGKRLHPDILGRADVSAIVPQHNVVIQHRRGDAGAAGNHYVIDVSGPRIVGRWPFRSGELEKLAREGHARLASS